MHPQAKKDALFKKDTLVFYHGHACKVLGSHSYSFLDYRFYDLLVLETKALFGDIPGFEIDQINPSNIVYLRTK